MPARLVHTARRIKLRAPTNWPWREPFNNALPGARPPAHRRNPRPHLTSSAPPPRPSQTPSTAAPDKLRHPRHARPRPQPTGPTRQPGQQTINAAGPTRQPGQQTINARRPPATSATSPRHAAKRRIDEKSATAHRGQGVRQVGARTGPMAGAPTGRGGRPQRRPLQLRRRECPSRVTRAGSLRVLGGESLRVLLQRRREQRYFTVPWPVKVTTRHRLPPVERPSL
jgi:hypothetical protein